jgi:hypothetical protein
VIFFGKQKPESITAPARALMVSTIVVTVFLIIEGFTPSPLFAWAEKGLSVVLGSMQ